MKTINEKHIEEASLAYCGRCLGISNRPIDIDNDDCVDLYNGYMSGYKDAIKQFSKNLWHDYKEIPLRKNVQILLYYANDYMGMDDDSKGTYDIWATPIYGFTEESYKELCNMKGFPSKWCYLKDVFNEK